MSKSFRLAKIAEPILQGNGSPRTASWSSPPVNWYGGLRPALRQRSTVQFVELKGWDYPKHLAGRLFSIVVHVDSIGAETRRRSLSDWLTDIDMISARAVAEKDGYIG